VPMMYCSSSILSIGSLTMVEAMINNDDSVAMEDDESYLPEFAISNYDRGQRGLQQQQARSLQAHASERIHSPSWDGLKEMIEDDDEWWFD